jgi:hypothetical protein
MIEVTLTVSKQRVYDEVAKTTSYTGAKMQGDDSAYDRIFTTDSDRSMLERFWTEACNTTTEQLKRFIVEVSDNSEGSTADLSRDYVASLELSSSYDENLTESIQASLFSFFVSVIVGKWFKFTNKDEADKYIADAVGMMNDAMAKICYRKKPVRVAPVAQGE